MEVVADVQIERPAREVFDYLADGEKMPRWMKEFTAVEKIGDAPIGQGTEFRYRDKRGTDSTYTLSQYQPPDQLAWQGAPVKMPGGSMKPDGRYELHEHGNRTHVTMYIQPQLHGFAKLMGPMMSIGMRRGSKRYVQLLKEDLERG